MLCGFRRLFHGSWLWETSSMLMMVWVVAHAEIIEVQYSVGFVVYFMALGNFVNVDDGFGFERVLRSSWYSLMLLKC